MAYFSQQELSAIKNEPSRQPARAAAKPKQQGRGGFFSSLISEAGGAGGALGGAALGTALLPGVGTVIGAGLGGFLGGTGGRVAENKVRDDRIGIGDALKEGAFSGVAGAGPIKLAKAASGAVKGATKSATPVASRADNALQGANDALDTPILSKLTGGRTDKAGQRLTESGSGLKADKNVGGMARLEDQSQFMSKYTGTPRQQRVSMEGDMKNLSKQVDDVLTKTPIPISGAQVGERLKAAADDLTNERYLDIDLNNPSVAKIIERYSQKFASQQDAKGVNDIVKTLNKTATRAQEKLSNPTASPLTAQESAALALKRAGDDVLSDIPEIAPLKKNMAQIFDVTPQVAKQAEKGITTPFFGGLKFKAPIQGANAAASKAGAALQGGAEAGTPGVKNFATRILAGRVADTATTPMEQQQLPAEAANPTAEAALPENIGGQAEATTAEDILAADTTSNDPFSPENVQATVKSILAQGGKQKDVAEYLSNVKMMTELGAGGAGKEKPLSAEASKIVSNAQTGIQALDDFEGALKDDPSIAGKRVIPGRGMLGGLVGGALGTSSADAAANQIVDVIARLRTGAAITNDEAKRFQTFIPQAFDDPATRNQKLNYLRNQFEMVANRSGSASTDLEAAITPQ